MLRRSPDSLVRKQAVRSLQKLIAKNGVLAGFFDRIPFAFPDPPPELASLTLLSFDFTGDVATVAVQARHSKHRRRDELPLHPELAEPLRQWMVARAKDESLWPGSWAAKRHAAAMLRIDLEAAGIAYRDGHGPVFDFHVLRDQFATGLARAGVHVRVAQHLIGIPRWT
jgi:integrase